MTCRCVALVVLALSLVAGPSTAAQDPLPQQRIPPSNISPPQITGIAVDGGTLHADPGVWSGTRPLTFVFEWLRCNAGGARCMPIPGAARSDRYAVSPADVGKRLRVSVTASNADGVETARSPATAVVVAAVAPVNTAPPVVTGTPREGQVLTASKGQWTGTPPAELAVRWERCTPGGTGCAAIPGATRDSYVLSSADVGMTVRVAVTASNPAGTVTARSPVTGVVTLSPLVNLEPPAIAGVVHVGLPLMATTGRWAPSGPIDFLYRWYRCRADGSDCDPIAGATSARYEVRLLDVGSRLLVRVTAISDAGTSTRESALTTVVAAPPAATRREPELMRPFPRVRIQGYFTDSGAVLQRVTVRGPRGARIAVSCRGTDCPFRRRTRRSGARVRIRWLERYLRAGTRIEIRVTKPDLIGKYTRIVIRAGRPPARSDRCIRPGDGRLVRCPRPAADRKATIGSPGPLSGDQALSQWTSADLRVRNTNLLCTHARRNPGQTLSRSAAAACSAPGGVWRSAGPSTCRNACITT